MSNHYDYKKFAILYVDDEEKSLVNFVRAFGDDFRILTASKAAEAHEIIKANANEIGVLITDQRMPGEKGVWLLERVRQLRPKIIRILATAYTDMDAAIAAVNCGSIYKYVTKPWDPAQLELTLRQSLDFFIVQEERDQLLREKMSILRNLMIADRMVSLGLLASGLSHHIRNSMVAVKTFLELAPVKLAEEIGANKNLRDPDFWRDYHQNVQTQIEKINRLLSDLRTASDIQTPAPFTSEARLHATVAQAIRPLQDSLAARRIEVDNQVPDSLPSLRVDQPKFDRLFELLLRDEISMLPVGSRITLAAKLENGEIVVTLADDGPAMPRDALRTVLDPFVITRSAPSEYGINLMACFFIVHHHGGRIDAQNPPEGGNRFTLYLPLKPEQAPTTMDETEFLKKAVLNQNLWEKLLTAG